MTVYVVRVEVEDARGRSLAGRAVDVELLSDGEADELAARLQSHLDDELKAIAEARSDDD
jgi:hypothetical protein